MATPPSFPTLAGLGWSVHKKPVFSTLVASHVSGREVRDAALPKSDLAFELTYRRPIFIADRLPWPWIRFPANAAGIFLTASRAIRDLPFRRSDRQRRDERDLRHRRRSHADVHLLALHGRFPRAGRLGSGSFERIPQRRQSSNRMVSIAAKLTDLHVPARPWRPDRRNFLLRLPVPFRR